MYELSDLIDVTKTQNLLDSFCDVVGIAAAIIDLNGDVLVGSRWQRICTDFHRENEETCEKCIESDTELANELQQGKRFSIYQCRNGLTDAASPIIIEGEHIANAFVGQFFVKKPDQEFFCRQAAAYGFNETDYLNALSGVPIVKEENLPAILEFLASFAEMVAKMGLERRRQMEAEESLRGSEKKFRNLFESSRDAIMLLTSDEGFLAGNPTAVELFRCKDEEDFTSKSPAELSPEYQPDGTPSSIEAQKMMARAKERGSHFFEWKHKKTDDTEFFADVLLTKMEFEGREILQATVRDITDRKRTEEDLRKSEAQYRTLIHRIPGMVYRGRPDWSVEVLSESKEVCGYSIEEFDSQGIHWLGIIHPDDRQRVLTEESEFHKQPGSFRQEYRIIDKDGSIRWVEDIKSPTFSEDGVFQGVDGIVFDITERVQAEEALQKSEERFGLFMDHLPGFAFIRDTKGKLLFANEYHRKLDVGEPGELIGHKVDGLWDSSIAKRFAEQDARVLSERRALEFEESYPVAEGAKKWLTYKFPILRENEPRLIGGISIDITERKRAEEALRESEEKFRSVVEQSADCIFLTDLETKCVIEVNPAMVRLLGYTVDELTGMPIYDIVADDRKNIDRVIQKIVKEGHFRAERPWRRKDGSLVDIEISVNLMNYGGREVLCNVARDISERKRAEEALRESEQKFRGVVEQAMDGMMLTDQHGNIIEWNQRMEEITGLKKDEFLGKPMWQAVSRMALPENKPQKTYAQMQQDVSKSLETDQAQFFRKVLEREIRHADGTIRNVEYVLYPIYVGERFHMGGVTRDITDRKQAEEALRESEERLRNLFENSRDAIFLVNRDGRPIDLNQAALDIFGYSRDEMLAMNTKETYANPDDREVFLKAMESKGYVKDYELKLKKKDGTEINCITNATFRYDDGGNVIGLQGILHDITAQKQAEEEKNKLETQLQQAQKMEAIGTLAGGIAHDFNNLLAVIQGHASLMSFEVDSNHLHAEHLKGIEEMVKRGADLTRQLLGFARRGKYEVKATNLNDLILESTQMFGRTKKEIKIACLYQKDIWPAEVDRGQIEQVLLNLYVNTWQAMPGGGELSLQTENVALDENYVKPFKVKPGNYVKISVADTGEGMDKETQAQIFDPFFTTKEMGKGTGLGLASAYGIIINHGGIINVSSEKGVGTTFSIYLPASEKRVPTDKELAQEVLTGTETILIVDDEDVIIKVGEDTLKTLGYTVMTARAGKEALEIYEEKKDEIDMVILDLIMPEMGGRKTYDLLKKINPNIKVLLSSGYSIDGEAKEILMRGCDGFIQKPFNMKKLSQKVREILDKE